MTPARRGPGPAAAAPPGIQLSQRGRRQVPAAIAEQGHGGRDEDARRTNAAIASALFVSDGAVEKHINNTFAKLGLAPADRDHRRVLAVLRYLGAD